MKDHNSKIILSCFSQHLINLSCHGKEGSGPAVVLWAEGKAAYLSILTAKKK